MSENSIKLLFALIKSVLNGNPLTDEDKNLFKESDLPTLYAISKKHDIAPLLSEALLKNGLEIEQNEYLEKLQDEQFAAVFRYEQQNFELNRIVNALEEAEIPFILLKGSVLREYYSKPWMRTSSDIDILIEKENLSRAENYLISKLGYSKPQRSNHDSSMVSKNGILLELHFDLIEDGRASDSRKVLSEFFKYSTLSNGFKFKRESADQMFYFYHIAHMAKHFESGGFGIRSFIDLWILNNKIAYNKEERKSLINKGGLEKFDLVCNRLCDVWFSGGRHTEATQKLEDFILSGGVYGSRENGVRVRQAKKGSKTRLVFRRILPSYKELKNIYPVLEQKPLLTPIYHIIRWSRILFKRQTKRAIREFKTNSEISKDETLRMQEFMNEIGLS